MYNKPANLRFNYFRKRVMSIVERILELEEQEQEVKDKIETLKAALDRKEWSSKVT